MKLTNTKLIFCLVIVAAITAWSGAPVPAGVSALCDGEGTRTGAPRFARILHDSQWMDWPSRMADPDWPSGFYLDWYPETVKFSTEPHGGDGAIAYDAEWLSFLRKLQPSDSAALWITGVAAGLFNKGNEFIPILDLSRLKDEPAAQSVSSGGNVVHITEFRSGSGRVEMLNVRHSPPNLSEVNYQLAPWLVTKFTSVSREGGFGNAGGIDVYFPNLSKDGNGYWVDLNRVELFPALAYCAEVKRALSVHAAPAIFSKVNGVVSEGQDVIIREYLPQGSIVWGRIDEGWILLEYLSQGFPIFSTTWEMETRPPIAD